jgi:hypothetical protein
MASTQTWSEGNGAGAATETASRAEANWKNIDDSTTAYSASPITAGANSFSKYQAIKFGGTYNTLSALSYFGSTSAPGTGLTVVAKVVTAGVTPAVTALAAASAIATAAGTLTANFTATTLGYAAGTATSTASAVVYGNALATQLQTTGSAAPGDITPVTITAQWTES